jgi:NAD(P)H dehydrogenase (quinone)
MNVLIVHAHPEPRSFASALKDTAAAELRSLGHDVRVTDLYAIGFEPRLARADFLETADPDYFKPQREQLHASECGTFAPDVQAQLDDLAWSQLVIFTFPLWWFSLPAILKGWVDRVFVMGRVYGGGKVHETGGMRGRRAMLCLTTGGPGESYSSRGRNGALDALLSHVQWGMLHFAGFEVLAPFVVWGPARAGSEDLAATLTVWRERLRAIEKEAPVTVGPLGG